MIAFGSELSALSGVDGGADVIVIDGDVADGDGDGDDFALVLAGGVVFVVVCLGVLIVSAGGVDGVLLLEVTRLG